MLRLTSKVKIGKYELNGIVDFESESSWETLTDTCSITLPRMVKWKSEYLYKLIKKGDEVTVSIGYDDRNHIVFEGYVTEISAKIPVKIKCQDRAWLLKQDNITQSYKDLTLEKLLKDILPSVVSFEAPALRLGLLRISNSTAAKVLDKLKQSYFLKAFFRNGKLWVGLAYWPAYQTTHLIQFDKHVVSDDLEFVLKDDIKIKLKVISISPDNEKKEYDFGDNDGEQRTLHVYDKNSGEIKHFGEQEIERLKYTGYRGSITIFGEPMVQHGDVVKLEDPFYPERNGSYLVKSVNREFGQSGYRQELTLDIKAG